MHNPTDSLKIKKNSTVLSVLNLTVPVYLYQGPTKNWWCIIIHLYFDKYCNGKIDNPQCVYLSKSRIVIVAIFAIPSSIEPDCRTQPLIFTNFRLKNYPFDPSKCLHVQLSLNWLVGFGSMRFWSTIVWQPHQCLPVTSERKQWHVLAALLGGSTDVICCPDNTDLQWAGKYPERNTEE